MRNIILDIVSPLLAADAAPQTGANQTGEFIKFIMMILVFGVMMWLLMIRPQQKRAKEHATLLKALKAGDKVVTSSGIVGVVVSVKEKTVTLRTADTKIEVLKSAVSDITERSGESSES
jgi:preprotein translocase subunit YajC